MNTRTAYLDARERLHDAVAGAGEAHSPLSLPIEEAKALLAGYPPDDGLPKSFANFDARYVPFLRNVKVETWRSFRLVGITVTPLADGGAVLAATDGHVLLLAHDKSARASQGGCRVIMSDAAMDACNPPGHPRLWWEGYSEAVSDPLPWTIPDRVLSIGASMLVWPKEQPPGYRGRKPDKTDGGALFAACIETSNVFRVGLDNRRGAPFPWWDAVHGLNVDGEPMANLTMSGEVLGEVTAAMAALSTEDNQLFWRIAEIPRAIVLRPTSRDDLCIIAMKARPDGPTGFPSWAMQPPPDAKAAPEEEKPGGGA